jgi:2-polyprenyl-3-methyl-5-hydroxy-6-metoxy-1,4-benzoquinol methylase
MDKVNWFNKFSSAPIMEREAIILDFCRGKVVLDVGCVGQDYDFKSSKWLHGKIAAVATNVCGVDIDPEGLERLQAEGYRVCHADEMGTLTNQFDVIVMSEVIEHVDNPVEFLKYHSKFLFPSGQLLVTTPNPFYAIQMLRLLLGNRPSTNLEHTMWFDPLVLTEVVRRAGLDIQAFFWLHKDMDFMKSLPRKQRFVSYFLHSIARVLYHWRHNFAPNFLMVLSEPVK